MSFGIVAALVSLGGGSAAVGTAIAATAAGTALSVYGQVESGKAQEEALEEQVRQEKIAAEGRELERRRQLNKALASDIVGLSISQLKGEGTPASLGLTGSKTIGTSEGMIGLSERLAEAQTLRRAKMARGTANIGAASTLLKGTSTIADSLV
jgi:alkylated DNA nucleotide flippase Atl1